LKAVKVIFKNGVFYPAEKVLIPEGTEGIVVFVEKESDRWCKLNLKEKEKRAVKSFRDKISSIPFRDLKLCIDDDSFEVFVLVEKEEGMVKPVMEAALKVYEETGVYIPVQVISTRRLERWKEQEKEIYQRIEKGESLK